MVVSHGIMADCWRDEIAGDDSGPLMDDLVKGVLAVRPGFASDNRPRLIMFFQFFPGPGLYGIDFG